MQEEGWRPCARERWPNFPPDQAGFAHSGDGDAAPASEEDVDGFCEGGIKPGLTSSMARASIASTLRAVSRLTAVSASSFMLSQLGRGNAAPLRIPRVAS